MRNKGKVRSWNEQKGFGFVRPSDGGKDLFLHVSALSKRSRVPRIGQTVRYTLSADKQGRPCAVKAQLPGDRLPHRKPIKGTTKAIFVAIVFLCIVTFLVFSEQLSALILLGYLVLSLITFLLYSLDKTASKKGSWRTSESTLHWLALAGGWPGALIAQQTLRHKSRKQSFRAVFGVTVVLNCCALILLSTPNGSQLLLEKVGAVFTSER